MCECERCKEVEVLTATQLDIRDDPVIQILINQLKRNDPHE